MYVHVDFPLDITDCGCPRQCSCLLEHHAHCVLITGGWYARARLRPHGSHSFQVDDVSSAASNIPIFTDLWVFFNNFWAFFSLSMSLTYRLGSIIISRFILDLRQANQSTSTPLSTLSFIHPDSETISPYGSLPLSQSSGSGTLYSAGDDRRLEENGTGRDRPE